MMKLDSLVDTQNKMNITDMIFKLSQKYCPVDTGRLKESGRIEYLDGGGFRIIYDCDYSVYVHEVMEYKHVYPTKSKFLEDAAYEVQALVQQGNEIPFTFVFNTDGKRVWLDIDTVYKDTFRLNEYVKGLYIDSLINNFEEVLKRG